MPNSGKFVSPDSQPIVGLPFPETVKGYLSTDKDYKDPKLSNIVANNFIPGSMLTPDNGVYKQKTSNINETSVHLLTRNNTGQWGTVK
jgi:hypothetical protein